MELTKELLGKIDQWVEDHMDRLVEDTCKLIRIRSVSDKTSDVKPFGQGCRDVLAKYIELGESYGLASRNYENYVVKLYVPETQGKPKQIGLMGHLDVVPEGDNWIYPPYEGIVKGDWIIGRGSQDNKGPCLAAMRAASMARAGRGAGGHDGIVEQDVENTLRNLGDLGTVGMNGTNMVILDMLLKKRK